MEDRLPGKVGASDLDFVLEQSKTGRFLVLEFKQPGESLGMGQRILLERMISAGGTVGVVWEAEELSFRLLYRGGLGPTRKLTVAELGDWVEEWWEEGLRNLA